MNETIARTLRLLPDRPGVYIMKNSGGQIIYIGKAKNLANRVRSYFHSPGGLTAKTRALVSTVHDISYIVADSELEALLLENNLIKKHKPYYNILLKDDKGYPYLRIDTHEPYPRITLARRLQHDGAKYFGPYLGAGLANDVASLAGEMYPLRTCTHSAARLKKQRPCVKYAIGACIGACRPECTAAAYNELVKKTVGFLSGDYNTIKDMLRQKMLDASEKQDYEKAAYYRDRIIHIDKITAKQKAVLQAKADADAVALSYSQGYAVFAVLTVRNGVLLGADIKEFPDTAGAEPEELMQQFLMQRYGQDAYIPKEILLALPCGDAETLCSHFTALRGSNVNVFVPQRGQKAKLCQMARENSDEVLQKSIKAELNRRERVLGGLAQLRDILALPGLPARIECFDISHIQGTDTVASMVVLINGVPAPSEYRRFKIKQDKNNDFESMTEVVQRRYRRAVAAHEGDSESAAFASMPDLIVIDGGKGQLSAACAVMAELDMSNIPIIGLAESYEDIYLPNQDAPLSPGTHSPAVHILQTVRDEAHRFAITYHRSLRNKRGLLSRLDGISGIGEKRKRLLFRTYGSVEKISKATEQELAALPGMTAGAAAEVVACFKQDNKEEDDD